MGIKMTDSQLSAVEQTVKVAEAMANQLFHIMENNGLTKVQGGNLVIRIIPALKFTTQTIEFGYQHSDAGFVKLAKGVHDEQFAPTGNENSAAYELLFANDAIKERMRRILFKEKPLPPDGLWIGDDRNDHPLDCYGREIRFDDLPVKGAINQ